MNKLYVDTYKLCKFMKRMAEYQQKNNLSRIRISINNTEFPIPNVRPKEKINLYNNQIFKKVSHIALAFSLGYKHFREEKIGKPDNSIQIEFIMKKFNYDKIVIDKSNLLKSKKILVYIYIKEYEKNYDEDLVKFVYNYVKSNFCLLTYKENETFPINKDYQDIIKRESYTQEELLKLYPLPKLDD